MIFVRYEDFDLAIRGFTIKDEEGNYNIYLNARYSFPQIRRTLAHELNHINRGDFEKRVSAHILEQ